jgi:hypothetical protein
MLALSRLHRVTSCVALLALLACSACTDFTHFDGTRISDSDIINGRSAELGGPMLGESAKRIVSTDTFLSPLDGNINYPIVTGAFVKSDALNFSIDLIGSSHARAMGLISRVDVDSTCSPPGANCPPRETLNHTGVSSRSSASEFGSISGEGLMNEINTVCNSQNRPLTQLFGFAGVCRGAPTPIGCFVDLDCGPASSGLVCDRPTCLQTAGIATQLADANDHLNSLELTVGRVDVEWVPPNPTIDFACRFALVQQCPANPVTFQQDPACLAANAKECAPVLKLRVSLEVEEDQVGLEPLGVSLEWNSIVGDYRVSPVPCGSPGLPFCATPPGPIYSPPPGVTGPNTLNMPICSTC